MKKFSLTLLLTFFVSTSSIWAFQVVLNSKPKCSIILPKNASWTEKDAAKRINDEFKRTLNVQLPIFTEGKKIDGNIISIGKTELATKEGLQNESFRYDGYVVRVKGNILFLYGRDSRFLLNNNRIGARGNIRAALRFLEEMGWKWIMSEGLGIVRPKTKSLSIKDTTNIKHNPPIMFTGGSFGGWSNWSLANGFRNAALNYTAGGHTYSLAVPAELYKEHPEYFALHNGKRLNPKKFLHHGVPGHHICPSHPEVLKLLAKFHLDKMEEGYDIVEIGQSDGYIACKCDRCKSLDRPGEIHEQIHYANNYVAKACLEKYPNKLLKVMIYSHSRKLPRRFNSYPKNCIGEVCFIGSLYEWERDLEKYAKLFPKLSVYVYNMGTFNNVGIAPKLSPQEAERLYRLFIRNNVIGVYFCGSNVNWGSQGPTIYTIGKVMNNPNSNWREAVHEYCYGLYGKASKTMFNYYTLLNERLYKYAEPLQRREKAEYALPAAFPYRILDKMETLLNTATKLAHEDGDMRAKNFIKVARISYEHFSILSKAYQTYNLYQMYPSMPLLKKLRDETAKYSTWLKSLDELETHQPHIKSYFPQNRFFFTKMKGYNQKGNISNNFGKLRSPFNWDYDNLIKHNHLPGVSIKSLVAHKIDKALSIDGDLSDSSWESIEWNSMQEMKLRSVKANTRFKIGYDEEFLYIAFECDEPKINKMKVQSFPRDGKIWETECVEAFFSPDGEGQKWFQFILSPDPTGQYESRFGFIENPIHPLVMAGKADKSWNPKYEYGYKFLNQQKKWTMEFKISFSEMGIEKPSRGTKWMGNFGRERNMWNWKENGQYKESEMELSLWNPNIIGTSFTEASSFGQIYFSKKLD